MRSHPNLRLVALALGAITLVAAGCVPPPTPGPPPPPSELLAFPVLEGLDEPTNVEFAPDGRVFVAEKSGIIRTYDSTADTTPTTAADLTADVRSVGEHGLLGMEVDPAYPARPFVYVMYAWDSTGLWGDGCAAGYGTNGCVTGARIAKLAIGAGGVAVGAPTTIVDNRWCYQFASHGVGDLEVLDDGSLIASSGEGAYWVGADYGQFGGQQLDPPVAGLTPVNACDDPPNGAGGPVDPTTSEGGSLRAQDLLTTADPVGWDGAVIRIDPDTGAPMADNPLVGVGPVSDDAVVAHGLRNPYRLTAGPGAGEVFAIDVGYARTEEINRLDVDDEVTENFGWPCKEGPEVQRTFDALDNQLCDLALGTSARTTLTDPWFSYARDSQGGAISAIAIVPPGRYDESMVGDLIFSDYVEGRTWTIGLVDGAADPEGPREVARDGIVVDLEAAPDGYVYAVDYAAGTVSRLVDKDAAPVARVSASPLQGPLPLVVTFDASASEQPGGGRLSFAWDLDRDGAFDDGTGPTATATLTTAVNRTVRVRVTNSAGAFSIASTTVYPGNSAPAVAIDVTTPLPWSANDRIDFTIAASDPEDGALAPAAVSWSAELHHCYSPTDCHSHPFVSQAASAAGSITGPSHGYPSFVRLVATAVDARGQRTTVGRDLHPAAVTLQFASVPSGAVVTIGDQQRATPFSVTVIRNDSISLSAPSPQAIGGVPHTFSSWSDGQPRSHQYLAGADATVTLQMSPSG